MNPVFAPVWAYVDMPPASLSAIIVMMPGPNAARKSSVRGREAALAIAKKRYANGEITKAEFEELKKDLTE